jgi:hypothetical protein
MFYLKIAWCAIYEACIMFVLYEITGYSLTYMFYAA